MTCKEFGQELPEFLEQGGREPQAHIDQCAACSSLVSDLRAITQQARELQSVDEPSPRVWNSIEIALKQEGLIRPQPQPGSDEPASLFSLFRRWGRAAWLIPAAAAVLVGAFLVGNPRKAGEVASGGSQQPRVLTVSQPVAPMSDEDLQVLSAVRQGTPMMTAAYETDLHHVNEYIQDAQRAVDENPNNEDARRLLMDAYEQKNMLYNIALEHSLQ